MGSQVNRKGREEKKRERKERKKKKGKEKEIEKEKKEVRSLDEWIFGKLGRQEDKFFFTKLPMQNIEEFCFISIVKMGHLLLPNF